MDSKLMMKLVVFTETFFFLSLTVAYLYFARSAGFAKEAAAGLHLKETAIYSVLLFLSSGTFILAERSYRKEQQTGIKIWLIATMLLAIIFLGGQMHEYYSLLKNNISISQSEFGTSFYTLTGFHALHVSLGIVMMGILCSLFFRKKIQHSGSSALATIGIYWHFVDIVWAALFFIIYLMPHFVKS